MHSVSRRKEFEAGFKAGIEMACKEAGVSKDEFLMSKAADAVIRDDVDAQRALCKIAKLILAHDDAPGHYMAVYDAIEKSASVVSKVTFDTYISPVLNVSAEAPLTADFTKSANIIAKLLSGAYGLSTDAFKTVLAAGALAGVTGGGALWAMDRGPEETDIETDLKRDQAAYYRRMAKDLRRKIAQEEAKNPKIDATRKAVEDLGYVV